MEETMKERRQRKRRKVSKPGIGVYLGTVEWGGGDVLA